MQLQSILNRVERQKGFVYRSVRWADQSKQTLLVQVSPHRRSRPICSGCGRKGPGYDRLAERRFEFVPLWAIAVFLVYSMRRVNCPRCGVTVERVPWADGKHRSTYSYRLFLATWAKRLSWKETASIFGTSWDTVYRAIEWVVQWGLAHRKVGEIEAIGIDEIQYRRGHRYLTLVYQIDADCRRLLAQMNLSSRFLQVVRLVVAWGPRRLPATIVLCTVVAPSDCVEMPPLADTP